MMLFQPHNIWRAITTSALLFSARTVLAAEENFIRNPIAAERFTDVIRAVTRFANLIIGPISVLVILYAGTLFMFSGGDVERVKRAKRALLWAIVGLAIVLIGEGFIAIIEDVLQGGGSFT